MRTLQQVRNDRTGARSKKQALYRTRRWKSLRAHWLTYNPLCVTCKANGKVTVANVVDHKMPHGGSDTLMWAPSNLQSMCRDCHNSKSASENNSDGVY